MVEKIISGAQTGVDRAALDFAIARGIPHGGWVPRGRLAEDGKVPAKYQVKEHPAPYYPPRTEANVEEADATVVFINGLLNDEKGCLLTVRLCMKHQKPYLVLNLTMGTAEEASAALKNFLLEHQVKVLNVAGPRGSRNPDISRVLKTLEGAI